MSFSRAARARAIALYTLAALAFASPSYASDAGHRPSMATSAGAYRRPAVRSAADQYTVLYSFPGSNDTYGFAGGYPSGSLFYSFGNLYGTTTYGGLPLSGMDGFGAVFRLSSSGNAYVLHRFNPSNADGLYPSAGFTTDGGDIYSTASSGRGNAAGTVFRLSPAGVFTTVYQFGTNSAADGYSPVGNLVNYYGTLYGATSQGGTGYAGVVFSITSSGTERVLHDFSPAGDGNYPAGGLVASNGVLYGTTQFGGSGNAGTVYQMTTAGVEKVIHSFVGGSTDGNAPMGELIAVNGTLYGITDLGGSAGVGTVYAITPNGNEHVLYSFTGINGDGEFPLATLVYADGALFGTTAGGGASGAGTVFEVTLSGSETVVHSFAGYPADGWGPRAGLIDVGGTLYGTTAQGGSGSCNLGVLNAGCGTIFALTP